MVEPAYKYVCKFCKKPHDNLPENVDGFNYRDGFHVLCLDKDMKAKKAAAPEGEHKPIAGENEIDFVLDMARVKFIKGEEKHGPLDIDTDPRNFIKEAIDELLDSIIYASGEVQKLMRVDKVLSQKLDAVAEFLELPNIDIKALLADDEIIDIIIAKMGEKVKDQDVVFEIEKEV